MKLNELPMGLALLLSENLIEDARTGRKSLIGMITRLEAERFPYTSPPLYVMISVTGCTGDFPCSLVCEEVATGREILNVNCGVQANSPFDVIDMYVSFKSLHFPAPGRYTFRVLADGVPIMVRPVPVLSAAGSSVSRKQESHEG